MALVLLVLLVLLVDDVADVVEVLDVELVVEIPGSVPGSSATVELPVTDVELVATILLVLLVLPILEIVEFTALVVVDEISLSSIVIMS